MRFGITQQKTFFAGVLALILVCGLVSVVQAELFKESWYMSRGKANMKIKNYKAAIEAFEKLVSINPENHEAMRLLGRAYELQGLTDKAIEHYDRHLMRFPEDADIAFKQARYLEAERFSYRRRDAIRYYRMGLKVKPNHQYRYRLAKLLAEDKETLGEAIQEYKILIQDKPDDAGLKAEYRQLLLWDDRYLEEAIAAYEEAARNNPNQFKIQHQLARLYYKDAKHTQKAIRLYGKLVAERPEKVDLRREYAKALAKSEPLFDRAAEQFRIVLKKKSDYETRLAYADLLAQNYSTTPEALIQYRKLVQAKPYDFDVRLKYARLLGAHRDTVDAAIEQYQILIDQDPENSTIHSELAAAYAWRGDNDLAIYHSDLALRHDSQDKAADRIRDDLMQGREPKLWTGATYIDQSGDDSNFDYKGYLIKAGGKADLTPFLTGGAEIGFEKYGGDEIDAEGTYYKLSLQGRFDQIRRVDLEWKYHNFDKADDDSEFLLQYSTQKGGWRISPGIRREFKYDSVLSIAGDQDNVTQRKIGAARSNTAFCRFSYECEPLQASAMPYTGYVSADSTDENFLVGADADFRYQFTDSESLIFATLYKLQLYHYENDSSGFVDNPVEPFTGGYFSPDFFANNALHLEFSYQFESESRLGASVGPSLQYKQEHSETGEWDIGGDLDLYGYFEISPLLSLTANGSYYQIAGVYRRYDITAMVTYKF